ncbi:MAG: hypothetical protein NTNFB02_34020 [Nitrospira sp.]
MRQISLNHAWLLMVVGAVTGIGVGPLTLETGAELLESSIAITEEKARPAEGGIQERGLANAEPPEALTERTQTDQAARAIQQGRQTPAQLRQMLIAHPDPGIRNKAAQAVSGQPRSGQPAGGEPPESQIERQEAQILLSRIQQGRLDSAQLRQLLLTHPDPGIRSKALKAQGAQPQRGGAVPLREPTSLLSVLWDLMNPFAATIANAVVPVSIRLTPQNLYVPPPTGTNYAGAYMNLYSASVTTTFSGTTSYQLTPPPLLVKIPSAPTPSNPTSTVPSHQIKVALNYPGPPGYYIIDVYGVGGANAKLYRYNFYGGNYHFVQAWAGGSGTQHYITVEYFPQGLLESYFFSIGQSAFTPAEMLIQQF